MIIAISVWHGQFTVYNKIFLVTPIAFFWVLGFGTFYETIAFPTAIYLCSSARQLQFLYGAIPVKYFPFPFSFVDSFKNAELICSIPEWSQTDRPILSPRIPLFFWKDFAFVRGLRRSSLNHKVASKLVESIQLLLGIASELAAVVQPLPDHLSGRKQLEWLYLEIHAFVRL